MGFAALNPSYDFSGAFVDHPALSYKAPRRARRAGGTIMAKKTGRKRRHPRRSPQMTAATPISFYDVKGPRWRGSPSNRRACANAFSRADARRIDRLP